MSGTRVGLVCGYLEPRLDGVADYTRRLAAHLRATGIDPVVFSTYELAEAAGDGVVGVTRRWDVRGVAQAARVVRRTDLDVVHVQFAPSVFGFSRAVGLLPLLLPRRTILVVTLHEYGVWSGRGPGRRARSALWSAAEQRGFADRETLLLAPRARCLLVPSAEHLDVPRARFRQRTPAAFEVPIGLNVDVTPADRARVRAEVRRELGVASDTPVVVFFGFLHPVKSLDRLIEAVAALHTQQSGTQLLLIGGEVSHSVSSAAANKLRRELEQVAAAAGVRDQVHFTGYLPDAEVSRLLQSADAAAFPFDAGVTCKSSSLLAALAAGLPVIATAAPAEKRGPNEANGVVRVQAGNTAALAEGLRQVLSDRARADRLTAAGLAQAATQSWDTIAAAHAEIYAWAMTSRHDGYPWTGTAEPSRVVPSTAVEGDADVTT
jgi:glycosyltransferase involved in cell wall biosynthesis